MPRIAIAVVVIAHAIVTGVVWTAPLLPDAPFNPARSWLLGESRAIAAPASVVIAVALAACGIGLLLGQPWWAPLAIAAGAAAAAFTLVYFNPWLSLGLALNAGIAAVAADSLSAS